MVNVVRRNRLIVNQRENALNTSYMDIEIIKNIKI